MILQIDFKTLTDKLLAYAIVMFGLFPILPNKLKIILVGAILVLSIVVFIKRKTKKLNYTPFFINVSVYIVLALSLLYTSNISTGIKSIFETRISGFIFPLIFLLISNKKEFFNSQVANALKNIFVVSTFLLCLIFSCFVFYEFLTFNSPFPIPKIEIIRNAIIKMPIIGIHPIYASIYICVSILFLSLQAFKTKKINFFKSSCLVLFITVLAFLNSKMAIISIIILMLILITSNQNIKKLYKILSVFLLVIILFPIFKISNAEYRFKEIFQENTYKEFDRRKSTSIRVAIYRCGLQVANQNLVFGVGVGDVKDELIDCYKSVSYFLVENKYNLHNQYLSTFLATGIFGLLLFLFSLSYGMYKSSKIKDRTLLYILLFYCLNFMTENILERQDGIMPFYFLFCYFLELTITKENENKLVKDNN